METACIFLVSLIEAPNQIAVAIRRFIDPTRRLTAGKPACSPFTMIADTSIRVKPRIMARGAADFCVGLFIVFPALFLALFILPGVIAFLLSRSWYVALAVPLVIYFVYLAFSVWSITLTAEGIRFNRLIGVPKFLPWDSISSVEVAPRWELVRHGWLWPLLPAREMTASLTSLQHYRIRWQSGFCYYPPADTEAFEQYVSTHLQRPVT